MLEILVEKISLQNSIPNTRIKDLAVIATFGNVATLKINSEGLLGRNVEGKISSKSCPKYGSRVLCKIC